MSCVTVSSTIIATALDHGPVDIPHSLPTCGGGTHGRTAEIKVVSIRVND